MVRKPTLIALGLVLFALPALAMTNAELQQYIDEINAAAQQGRSLPQPATTAPAPLPAAPKPATSPTSAAQPANTTVSYNGTCPIIKRLLTLGAKGEDVSALQRYLTETGDYTYGQTTGYFGPVTQAAVQRYQARNGIVSSGTPDSTGYGAVGPRTRAAIENCATASGGTSVADQIAALLAQVAQLQALLARLQGQQPPIDTSHACSFNNQSVAHGQSITAYRSSNVPLGQQCVSENRTCTNGTLSGSYQYASCTVAGAASCIFNGQTIAHNASITAHQSPSVPSGQQCSSQTRTCTNGALSGSYTQTSCLVEQLSDEFRPESYGAVADNTTDSTVGIQQAIAAAIARGPGSKVILSAGTYRVSCTPGQGTHKQHCFDIQGVRDLSIEGKGSGSTHIIVTTPTSGLFSLSITGDIFSASLVRNENVRFTGFSVDYDPLPYTQGTIIAVNAPNSVDVRLDTGMPLPTSASFAPQIYSYGEPFSILISPSSPKMKLTADSAFHPTPTPLSGDVWRYTDTSGKLASQAAVGDRLVQQGGRAGSDVLTIYESKDVTVRDVVIYASPGIGITATESYGIIRLDGVQVRIKSGTNRLLSANSNATMMRSNRAQPIIENGYFEGNGDDVIDIGANGQFVKSVLSDTRLTMEASWLPARVGDLLQIISPCGALRGEAIISAITLDQQTKNYDVTLATPILGMRSSGGTTTCTVSGTSPFAPYDSDLVINIDTSGLNSIIRNNTFAFARGTVLINSIGTRIEGNRFTNFDKQIRIGYSSAWRRGPLSRNITIDNNDFANTNATWPIYIGFHQAGEMPISNITISNNRFRNAQADTITIDGARNITLRNNSIVNDTNWPSKFTGNVMIDHATGIVIDGLTITDMRTPRMAGL
ncbi:MAG: peptidoglycan-binding protein, partial [Patescibacteria group bacterium]